MTGDGIAKPRVATGPAPLVGLARWSVDRRIELVAFGAIVVMAALLRFGDLAARGTWDADQGHDMLVLRRLVFDGQVPLLGPPTSIGDFHHGVLYYVLLAPVAFLSRADPVAVMTFIAFGGVVAVAVTGWLARSIAGPLAGLIAALLLAVSSSAVEESIFIWNPNLIALSSSIALAAAWRAWTAGGPGWWERIGDGRRHAVRTAGVRWWIVAGGASVVTMHCHVLGVILTPMIAALLIADLRRRARRGDRRGAGRVGGAALVWIGMVAISYVPLLIHELGANFSEVGAAAAFLGGSGGPAAVSLPIRIPIIGLRVVGWPLVGLITAAPAATLLAAGLVAALAAWRGWAPRVDASVPADRTAVRWLTLGLVWTIVALAVGASSLATVVAGLPNDHYHAFADPIVVTLVAIGLAALAREPRIAVLGRWLVVGTVVIGLVVWNLANQPPARAADGGWSAARSAAERVLTSTGTDRLVLVSLPIFKSDEALRMPLATLGAEVEPRAEGGTPPLTETGSTRVVLCDQLFRESIGADCGGPAEDALISSAASGLAQAPALVDRFEAAPGRWISVYRP